MLSCFNECTVTPVSTTAPWRAALRARPIPMSRVAVTYPSSGVTCHPQYRRDPSGPVADFVSIQHMHFDANTHAAASLLVPRTTCRECSLRPPTRWRSIRSQSHVRTDDNCVERETIRLIQQMAGASTGTPHPGSRFRSERPSVEEDDLRVPDAANETQRRQERPHQRQPLPIASASNFIYPGEDRPATSRRRAVDAASSRDDYWSLRAFPAPA